MTSNHLLRTAAGVAVLALLVGGCGTADGEPEDGAGNGVTVGTDPATTGTSPPTGTAATTATTATTGTEATTATAAPVTAADGTRYAACATGSCEVAVSRPRRIPLADAVFRVLKVVPNRSVDFDLAFGDGAGGASGTLQGPCSPLVVTLHSGGGHGSFCDDPADPPPFIVRDVDAVTLRLIGWTADGAAVVRLARS